MREYLCTVSVDKVFKANSEEEVGKLMEDWLKSVKYDDRSRICVADCTDDLEIEDLEIERKR